MRIRVANIQFDNVTMEETVARISEMAELKDRPRHVCTGNLDHLALLQQDEEFRAAYDRADLAIADGMPVVWLSRMAGRPGLKERVAGSDLFWEVARVSHATGIRLFYLGGAPGSAAAAASAIRNHFPNVNVCGVYCPPFAEFGTGAEQDKIREMIREAAPHVLFVALGSPKQEKWIVANKERLGVPVSIGVGASFEMAAGVVRRAPVWMQRTGTEWAYRLVQEPSRMARRYLARDLPFFVRLVAQTLGSSFGKRHPAAGGD